MAQTRAGRIHKLAQEHREEAACLDVALRPLLYLPRLDGQKLRDLGRHHEGLAVAAARRNEFSVELSEFL